MTRRVAILCEFSTMNGGERSLLASLPFLPTADWLPLVLCPPSGALAGALRIAGVETIPFEMRDAHGSARPPEELRAGLADGLRRLAPQLVHANSISTARLSGPVVERLGLPSIGHLRDIVSLSRPAVANLNLHTRLLAVSEATRTAHIAQGVGPAKTHVLFNGVDLHSFAPQPATGWLHAELALPRSAKLIGVIGQISLRKGLDVLAAAAERLALEFPDLHCVFVGARHSEKTETRQLEADLRARFSAPPLTGHGHFLGTRDDVVNLLPELTLLVHPARQEPLGRVLLEGAASGCAIVATDVGGTQEIFPPGAEAALLVPADRPDQLAAAMARLLHDGDLRLSIGRRARQRAEAAFSAATSAAGLIAHYNDVANR